MEPLKIDVNQQVGIQKGEIVGKSIAQLAEAHAGNVQKIAATQISLLTSYYNAVLTQASKSFRWALTAAGTGLIFFIGAVTFLMVQQPYTTAALVSTICGALIEIIAGINFSLYGKTSKQLADFHLRLDRTQRFLLANSISEALDDKSKQEARLELVKTIANWEKEIPQNREL